MYIKHNIDFFCVYVYIYIYIGLWHDGYRKEKSMSQNLFIIQAPGLALYSGKLSKFFFWLLPASVDFIVGSPRGTAHIQTIFDVSPRVSKNVMGYRNHSVPFPGFQTLKIVDFDVVDEEVRTHLYHMILLKCTN